MTTAAQQKAAAQAVRGELDDYPGVRQLSSHLAVLALQAADNAAEPATEAGILLEAAAILRRRLGVITTEHECKALTAAAAVIAHGAAPLTPRNLWKRHVHGDKSVSWVLLPRGDATFVPVKIITTQAMDFYGRERMEASLAEQGLPLLPDEAWKTPAP
jgi:hypothetical protein